MPATFREWVERAFQAGHVQRDADGLIFYTDEDAERVEREHPCPEWSASDAEWARNARLCMAAALIRGARQAGMPDGQIAYDVSEWLP